MADIASSVAASTARPQADVAGMGVGVGLDVEGGLLGSYPHLSAALE